MPTPLAGRRILDLGALCAQPVHALAASMAARLCVGYGATVVRPCPPEGEPFSAAVPLLPDGRSALDCFVNAGKIEGEIPNAVDAAIGDTAALAAHAADVAVCVRFSAFGAGEDPPTSELVLEALSGLLDVIGEIGGPPTRMAGHQIAYAAGLSACTGLLAALLAGRPETVDVSLFDVAAWLNWKSAASAMIQGKPLIRGNPRNYWRVMPAADGHIALVYQDKDWPALKQMISDPRLDEPRFATAVSRAAEIEALTNILRPWFAQRSRAQITHDAQARRIPIGPVLMPAELMVDPQYRARAFLRPDGMPRLPVMWDGERLKEEDRRLAV